MTRLTLPNPCKTLYFSKHRECIPAMRDKIISMYNIHVIFRELVRYFELDDVWADLGPIIDVILKIIQILRTKGSREKLTATTVLNESTSTSSFSTPSS